MKLINYFKSISESSNRRKLLSIYLITLDRKIKFVHFDFIRQTYKISNEQIVEFIENLPTITIENYDLKFKISDEQICIFSRDKKNQVEPTTSKKIFIENVLNILNEITGKKYRYSSKKNRTVILARIKEGYTYDEFVHVIHCQSIRWLGTESELYLRPETLFGTKMEGYVNLPLPTSKLNKNKLEKIHEAISTAKEFDWSNNS